MVSIRFCNYFVSGDISNKYAIVSALSVVTPKMLQFIPILENHKINRPRGQFFLAGSLVGGRCAVCVRGRGNRGEERSERC